MVEVIAAAAAAEAACEIIFRRSNAAVGESSAGRTGCTGAGAFSVAALGSLGTGVGAGSLPSYCGGGGDSRGRFEGSLLGRHAVVFRWGLATPPPLTRSAARRLSFLFGGPF